MFFLVTAHLSPGFRVFALDEIGDTFPDRLQVWPAPGMAAAVIALDIMIAGNAQDLEEVFEGIDQGGFVLFGGGDGEGGGHIIFFPQ